MGRRLGQHFLTHQRALERIAEATCPEPTPLVIEIGPGTGNLTACLLRRAEHVIAIEIDPVLVGQLRARFSNEPRLTILHADALATPLDQWGPAVVTGNLPYYISSPLLEKVLRLGPLLQRAVFTVQKEVAARLLASPGTRNYGYLTVAVQLRARPEILFTLPPVAFSPPPKVYSAVVRLQPKPLPQNLNVDAFLDFARACFRHKRKILKHNLTSLFPLEPLAGLPELHQRAEQLSLDQLLTLYHKLTQLATTPAQPQQP